MGKTIINVAITMADDEWDRFDNRFQQAGVIINGLTLIECAVDDALINELGVISKSQVTKIE